MEGSGLLAHACNDKATDDIQAVRNIWS